MHVDDSSDEERLTSLRDVKLPPEYLLQNITPYKSSEYVYNWRVSEANETLSVVYNFELVRYIYIYI